MDIFAAVEQKNMRELKRILRKEPSAARTSDCWGRTALMLACIEGEEALVELLVPWSDATASNRDGETALMLAAFGHPKCVELLLPLGNPLACDADEWTALMWAASSGSERCVELLLPHSDVKATTTSGLNALDIARTYDQRARAMQIPQHLIEVNETGQTSAVLQVKSAGGRL